MPSTGARSKPMPSRFMRKSAATKARAKWLVSGTPVTLIFCGPSNCSICRAACRGLFVCVGFSSNLRRPSSVGSIEQLMPVMFDCSAARSATIKSSKSSTGWPLAAPTTLPSASTRQPSAGPASTTSCSSGYTSTYFTRVRPAMKRTASAIGWPACCARAASASRRFKETNRSSVGCCKSSGTSCKPACQAWRSSFSSDTSGFDSTPSTSTFTPPTAPPRNN